MVPSPAPEAPPDRPFPWVLVGAAAVAVVALAVVIGVTLGSGDEPEKLSSGSSTTEEPASSSTTPVTTTSATSTEITTSSSAPLPPPIPPTTAVPTTTRPPTTTTTAPPSGFQCPSGQSAKTGTVVLYDDGWDYLKVRKIIGDDDSELAAIREYGTVEYFPQPANRRSAGSPSYGAWIIVRVPNQNTCGWASAPNIKMNDDDVPSLADKFPSGCNLYEASSVVVSVCPTPNGPVFRVTWQSAPDDHEPIPGAKEDGDGWTAQLGQDLFRADGEQITIKRNNERVMSDTVNRVVQA